MFLQLRDWMILCRVSLNIIEPGVLGLKFKINHWLYHEGGETPWVCDVQAPHLLCIICSQLLLSMLFLPVPTIKIFSKIKLRIFFTMK